MIRPNDSKLSGTQVYIAACGKDKAMYRDAIEYCQLNDWYVICNPITGHVFGYRI